MGAVNVNERAHSAFKELENLVVPTTCIFLLEDAKVIIRSQLQSFQAICHKGLKV